MHQYLGNDKQIYILWLKILDLDELAELRYGLKHFMCRSCAFNEQLMDVMNLENAGQDASFDAIVSNLHAWHVPYYQILDH